MKREAGSCVFDGEGENEEDDLVAGSVGSDAGKKSVDGSGSKPSPCKVGKPAYQHKDISMEEVLVQKKSQGQKTAPAVASVGACSHRPCSRNVCNTAVHLLECFPIEEGGGRRR